MIFTLVGLFAGFILNLLLLIPETGVSITPRFYSSYDNIETIEKYRSSAREKSEFSVKTENGIYLVDNTGRLLAKKKLSRGLAAVSGNGRFFVKYMKVGDSVELYNIRDERFWKIRSLEYPSLSYSGKLILLLNGDQSRVRAVDENGRIILKEGIQGRFCNLVSFAERSDLAAVGFLDGSYHLISRGKGVVLSGNLPPGDIVKGLSPSNNGKYLTIRYGDAESDTLRLINIPEKSSRNVKLKSVRYSKSPIHISDTGITTILGKESILNMESSGEMIFRILIPRARESFARISFNGTYYAVTYSMESGGSKLIVFNRKGKILFSREYTGEAYLDNEMNSDFILLKGSGHICCYRLDD
jgi:hypothetical protein